MPKRSASAPPAADPLSAAVFAELDRRLDPHVSWPVAVAFSGGGDSLALLLIAADWARARGRSLAVLTVDHGLHPESAGWTEAAGRLAGNLGLAWRALAWTGDKPAAGLPAAARAARHRLLAEAARSAGARVILTGHTLDDRREEAVMRQADAPGIGRLKHWSPSPVWPEGRDIFILRPLLDLEREALRDWLRSRGWSWLNDPANDDLRFARARARASRATASAPLPPAAAAALSTPFETTPDGRLILAHGEILKPGGPRLLAAALVSASGVERPPRRDQLARLVDALSRGAAQATLAGARLVAEHGRIDIGRNAGERARGGLQGIALAPGRPAVFDGRFLVAADQPGWRCEALAGRIGQLEPGERAGLKALPAWARAALPALVGPTGEVRLPRPLGRGPGEAQALAAPRFLAACGLIARESQIGDRRHGA